MPKSRSNSRPDNRSQKREVKKRKSAGRRATKAKIGKEQFTMFKNPSPGVAAQGRRSVAQMTDEIMAKKIKPKRGRRKK